LVRFLQVGFKVGERRACRLLGFSRSTVRYRSRKDPQNALRIRLKDLAAVRVRWGYRRLHVVPQREGWEVNH
jgi:putative transposase